MRPDAERSSSREPIELRLIRKYGSSKLKLEKLREEREKEELAKTKVKPSINDRSRKLASNFILKKLKSLSPDCAETSRVKGQESVRVVRVSLVDEFRNSGEFQFQALRAPHDLEGQKGKLITSSEHFIDGLASPFEDDPEAAESPMANGQLSSISQVNLHKIQPRAIRSCSPKVRVKSPTHTYTELHRIKKDYSLRRKEGTSKSKAPANKLPSPPLTSRHKSQSMKQLSPFFVKISYKGGVDIKKFG
eukprot:CAMPEP_0204897438 /NCGR_PEP_ID=MMETSP1397-20131031/739_1 /ASSEMBLY_ACC=CAM_ASM_000891 /TAXON_ID=49980 /ORGANISM="Climacostomum Climacostomum virens, Strain Stock W-24" /LENGTH=247 /DNA_ID=CAMNT_0052065191 /DNA_START=252 /DNA_END=992 /DNA_ORIENTATION=+